MDVAGETLMERLSVRGSIQLCRAAADLGVTRFDGLACPPPQGDAATADLGVTHFDGLACSPPSPSRLCSYCRCCRSSPGRWPPSCWRACYCRYCRPGHPGGAQGCASRHGRGGDQAGVRRVQRDAAAGVGAVTAAATATAQAGVYTSGCSSRGRGTDCYRYCHCSGWRVYIVSCTVACAFWTLAVR